MEKLQAIIDQQKKIIDNLRTIIRHCDSPEADNPRFQMVLELTKKDKVLSDQLQILKGKLRSESIALDFKPKSIFTRRQERHNKAYDFVVKHKVLIYQCTRHYGNFTAGKDDYQLQLLIDLARNEIGYSNRTWSGDIFTSLVNLYKKICV